MTERIPVSKTEKLLTLPVALVLLAFFAVFCLINYPGFERMCTADMYEDTLVARLMWEQKTLFPEGYTFGNQFYVVATPVLAALFYGLTGSLNTGMALATTAMSAFILLSFAWMLRPFAKNGFSILCGMLALVSCAYAPFLPSLDEGQLFFIMASYYACYLICVFVCFGDYVRASFSDAPRPAAFILSLLLCFGTGMQSLRQTCVSVLPVLALELALCLYGRLRPGAGLRCGRRGLVRALGCAMANLAGVGLMKLLDKPQYTIYNGASVFDGASVLGKLQATLSGAKRVSGLEWVGGGNPLVFTLLFVFFTAVLLAAARLALKKDSRVSAGLRRCWWLCVISLLAVVSASLVTSVNIREIYLFMYYPLLAFSFVMVMDRLNGKLRAALAALLCLLAVGGGAASYREVADYALDDTPTDAQQVCELAMEGGYELVYGSLDHSAAKVAVWSDGALTAGGWEQGIIFKVVPYINAQDIYDWTDYRRAVFVIMPWEEEACRTETEGNGAQLTLLGQYGEMKVYSSDRQLLYPLSSPPGYDPEA